MNNKYERAKKLTNEQFKRVIGVKMATFEEMKSILEVAYAEKHQRRGRHSKLSVEEMLFLAFEYGVAESTAHDSTVWVEDVLIKSEKFSLPGKKVLLDKETKLEIVLVDVTESPIERPKKQKKWYSGKKKRHTIKTQLVVDANDGKVLCAAHAEG